MPDTDRVEVDLDAYETVVGSDASASTSLRPSILSYEWKHGRRYHSYQAGAYSFPNDEHEQARLDMLHHVFFRLLHDRLYLAPINPSDGLRILDIGTGTGMWALHLGEDHPGAKQIVGNDLSPIQSPWCPPNVKFIVDDVELDWAEPEPYDYVHVRYMAGAIQDWPKLVRQIFANLKPGGYVEFQETANTLYSQDGSLKPDNAMVAMMDGLMEGCRRIGRTLDPAPEMEGWCRTTGFEDVNVQKFQLPIGGWPRDARLKEIGTLMGVNFIEGVEAFTAALFKDVLGWTKEEVDALNSNVRAAVRRGDAHAIFDCLVVTARKPL